MKVLPKMIFLFLFSQSIFAHSVCAPSNQVIPFQNFSLAPNCSINASYSFGNFSQLFCFTNGTQTTGSVTWTYKGVTQPPGGLPILLTTKATFQGQFIDPAGKITILNTISQAIIVSCVFTY